MTVIERSARLRSIVTRRSLLPPPAEADDPAWDRSWEHLCRVYAPAMRGYVRQVLARALGRPPESDEAEDVVQAYLAEALEKGWLSRDGGEIRCFRAYLQAQLQRYAISYLRHKTARKRQPRGTEPAEVLEGIAGETADPAAQAALDEGWVGAVVEQVLARLAEGSATYHAIICDLLETDGAGSADLAERLGRSPKRLKDLRHRARRRFAMLFFEELRLAVRDDAAFEELCLRLEPYLP